MTKCWIITEAGLTGTENQCLGIAEALGVNPAVKHIGLRQPWKSLSPWLGLECASTFTGDTLKAPWPDLVIAAGRKAIAAARYIKKQSGGKTFTVQIQDPRTNPNQFDLVAVPEHDRLRGSNVIVTQATPNGVFSQRLADAKEQFLDLQSQPPTPHVAVLIGGTSKAYTMTPAIMKTLAKQLKQLASKDLSLMVTASRRTGKENSAVLHDTLKDSNAYIWDGTGDNPYYGFLAWADYIIVTADSASMISEACTTGKPVYMVELEGGSKRFDTLHKNLEDKGILRRFSGELEDYSYTPLQDAHYVAQEIKKRMK